MKSVPVIDIGALVRGTARESEVADAIGDACRESGFFYVVGHGVEESLQRHLENASRAFFAQPLARKMEIPMASGGRAWRGYFPVGGELTSGKPDIKEGIYFGRDLPASDHRVLAETPLHGPNLFPDDIPELRAVVHEYMNEMERLGHLLMSAMATSLGLEKTYFADHYTRDPLILFRIFNYPPPSDPTAWGVGEHTDYGFLTILKQDDCGGLEVKTKEGWIPAPPIPNSFVCNLGDMLDRMTGGLYRSTPHRVKNTAGRERLSYPFFFDPDLSAKVGRLPIPGHSVEDDASERWDGASVHELVGTYGDYLLSKISKVFPDLKRRVLSD